MHRRVVFGVSAVLFTLLAVLVVVMTDLHDRTFPQSIGAQSSVNIDVSSSSLDDGEIFTELIALSDRLDLGLVKVAPDLSGDQSGRVFVVVGDRNPFAATAPLFNDNDAEVRDNTDLATSYATGQYLITSEDAQIGEFQQWLSENGVTFSVAQDSATGTLRALVAQRSFGVTVLAATALLGSLVLYWLSVKSRGRSLRVLAGTPTRRIQYEDIAGLMVPIVAAALFCGIITAGYVAVWHGWVFVPFVAQTLLLLDALVLSATLVCAVVMSTIAIPSTRMLADRVPEVTSLHRASLVLKAATFALVVATVAPAFTALGMSRDTAAQQAQWRSLSDQVSIAVPAAIGESGFQQLMEPMGKLIRDAEAQESVALSYTWPAQFVTDDGGDPGSYDAVALVNQHWLDLMGVSTEPDNDVPSGRTLRPAPEGQVPQNVQQWLGPNLELWTRDGASVDEAFATFGAYEYAATGDDSIPMASAGGGDLLFTENVLVIIAPSLYESFNDDFLTSIASTSNVVFSGLKPTQDLIRAHDLQDVTRVQYIAEEGLLLAQYTAYFAWLQGVALVALVVALSVAASISAFVVAIVRARRDFPLILSGLSWPATLGGRIATDWTVFAVLTVLILVARGFDKWPVVLGASLLAAVAVAFTHYVATQWSFANVSRRRI